MTPDVSLMDNFRVNLRAALAARQLSYQDLGSLSGVHRVTISRIMTGRQDPTVQLCERLATAAGVRPDLVFLEPAASAVDSL